MKKEETQTQKEEPPKQEKAGEQKGRPKGQPKGRAARAEPAKPAKDYGKDFRGVVRLAGKDIKGELPLRRAVTRVRGVGERLGAALGDIAIEQMRLANDIVIGLLTEEQMDRLADMLAHPGKYGVPPYLLNRQKDPETGEDRHLVGTDVNFTMRQDIEKDKNMNTWRGYRHLFGQKVRGQHTRTSGRTGMTVGVMRKAVAAAKEAAVAAEARPRGGRLGGGEGEKPPKEGEAPAASRELLTGRTLAWDGGKTVLTLAGQHVALIELKGP